MMRVGSNTGTSGSLFGRGVREKGPRAVEEQTRDALKKKHQASQPEPPEEEGRKSKICLHAGVGIEDDMEEEKEPEEYNSDDEEGLFFVAPPPAAAAAASGGTGDEDDATEAGGDA